MPDDGATTASCVLPKAELMGKVVVDHPLAPERRHGIHVKHEPVPLGMNLRIAGGCGIEGEPSFAGDIGIDPGMSVAGPHNVLASDVDTPVSCKSVHQAR